jgi:hypothetical protein
MLVTFPTRKSWSEHELTQHRICHDLKCHLCPTRFTAENTLSEHFQLKHDLSQRHSKLLAASSLAKSSERVSAKEEQCPLCLQSDWSDQRKFVTHLGRHLEEIALSVLPREVDCDSDQQSDGCGTSEDTDAPWSPSCQLNKKEKDGGAQRSKSTRRVSFNMTKGAPKRYEYYSFIKSDSWRVADRIKISAPQEILEKTVAKGKKSSSVLDTLKKMSPDRRAQIDRLLNQKNLGEENKDAQWHCVFIDSPSPQDKDIGGKRIREHRKMNVIVAQHLSAGRAKSASGEKNKSFAGERSDINDPLKPKDKAKDKDQPSKGGKDGKDGNDRRDDPFDSKLLFTNAAIPMDKHGPISGYPPQQQPFDPGMGHPFDPPGAQPMGAFQTSPPEGNQLCGDRFSQPQPGHQLHHGLEIEILDDPPPPLNGANNFFYADDRLPPGEGHNHPPCKLPHFQQPHINEFSGPRPPSKLLKGHMQPWEDDLPSEQNSDSRAESTENYHDRNSSRMAVKREQPKRDSPGQFCCDHPDCQSTGPPTFMSSREWK